MAILWAVESGHNLGTYSESTTQSIPLPVSATVDSIELLSGDLPPGLRIEDKALEGTPFEVPKTRSFTFVLRAKRGFIKEDRTFNISIAGADEPEWLTPEGPLGLGPNGKAYILDSSIVDFQLNVLDPDIPAGQELEFWIGDRDGELPPGLQLTTDGRIVGIVEPLLYLEKIAGNGFYDTANLDAFPFDFGIKSSNGFDSYYYDTTIYDYNIPTRVPKKLNRYYEFTVNVSDGDTVARRQFQIYLVGDDFLRADNTIMQIGTGLFTADNTYLRKPVWLTPSDLGYRRANNYVTLFLDVYDPASLQGPIFYQLEETNDDGSPSVLPKGLSLDSSTGEIAGISPYQPAVTREYKFTVSAIRQEGQNDYSELVYRTYEDVKLLGGTKFVKIALLPNTDDVPRINRLATLSTTYATVQSASIGEEFYTLTLNGVLESEKFFTAVSGAAGSNIIRINLPSETDVEGVYWDGAKELTWNGIDIVTEGGVSYGEITLSEPLTNSVSSGQKIYYGTVVPANTEFNIVLTEDTNVFATSTKTFTVRMLGEVDSTISWLTGSDLGTIRANFISTLAVQAETTVPNGRLVYSLINGKLPPGLSLALDGEIVGKVNQFGSLENPGLTVFDSKTTTFDGGTTTVDRDYTFTIRAQDQFGFSAIERTFTISTSDPDEILYSNLFMRPFLKQTQKDLYRTFISNPNIFEPNLIYRPNDTEFGLQTEPKMLAYAGIETKNVQEYVAAAAKNHKKKRYRFGEVKTAVARRPGTQEIVYEVVYVEIIDPDNPTLAETRKSITIDTNNKITVDSVKLEAIDDNSGVGLGQDFVTFFDRFGTELVTPTNLNELFVYTRDVPLRVTVDGTVEVSLNDGSTVVTTGRVTEGPAPDPYRFRPNTNTIKIDSNAVKVSDGKDQTRWISNIRNMRDNLKEIGLTEREFLPLWMRTRQTVGQGELGYIPAVPLCYCKPGESGTVLLNIKNSGFDFKDIDFEIDRYVIDSTTGVSNEQYILFANYQFNV
jgi:hypothetical protein